MKSVRIKIINWVMHTFGSRNMDPAQMRAPARNNSVSRMKKRLKNFYKQEEDILSHKIVTFFSPNPISKLHIIYLHGGAYVWQGSFIHWNFIKKLLGVLDCKVSYFDYPLAPEHTYIDTFEMLQKGFDYLVNTYPHDDFVFVGDSSGGGLALAFAQKLVKEKYPIQPKELILLSPWLDLALGNPEIPAVEKQEHMLSVNGLRFAGKLYAGDIQISDYKLSPLNGDTKGLNEITIFIGTDDILWPDCKKLREKVIRGGESILFFEYPEMPHDFMFFPFPETKHVFALIEGILLKYLNNYRTLK